jgi:hypothetical protein
VGPGITTPILGDRYDGVTLVPDTATTPKYSIDFVDAYPTGGGVGDTLQGRWGTSEAAAAAMTPEEYTVDESWWVDGVDQMPDLTTFCIAQAESTTVHFQVKVVRGASESGWSNFRTFVRGSETETASSWATTTGQHKSTWMTVNGTGNLVATGTNGFTNAPTSVRATQARTGKRQFELTITTRGGTDAWHIGVDEGSDYFGDGGTTNYTRPGRNDSTGVTLKVTTGSGTWQISHGGAVQQSGTETGAWAAGDKMACEFDAVAGTVSFYTSKASVSSGAWTQRGTTVTGISLSSWYANMALEDNDVVTAKFDSGQSHTLSSGYLPYDNL